MKLQRSKMQNQSDLSTHPPSRAHSRIRISIPTAPAVKTPFLTCRREVSVNKTSSVFGCKCRYSRVVRSVPTVVVQLNSSTPHANRGLPSSATRLLKHAHYT